MLNFYSNDFEIVLTIVLVSIFTVIFYDAIKSIGKLHLTIFRMKINILNKNNWNDSKEITPDTKFVELDFVLQFYNNQNRYNSIYNIEVYKKKRLKYEVIENNYLNLTDSVKSISGTTTYEKLKYLNFLPFEVKEFRVKIKLTKDEFENSKKHPICIRYKKKKRWKKIKLQKYLKSNKEK